MWRTCHQYELVLTCSGSLAASYVAVDAGAEDPVAWVFATALGNRENFALITVVNSTERASGGCER